MNFKNALNIAKLAYDALTSLHSSGTSMPGKILSKLYPEFLKEVRKCVTDELFAVTGTNGKTTTSGLLAQILKTSGRVVIHNELGANMPNGIITALALGIEENLGRKEVNNIVIESDEAYLKKIFEKLEFDYLILTNLFCDQTDRYCDPRFVAEKIQEATELNPSLKIILNADDPNLDNIGKDREKIYFGLEKVELFDSQKKITKEPVYCGACTRVLDYTKRYYSQLGDWHCECGRARPILDVAGSVKIFKDYSYLDVKYKDKSYSFKLKLTGLYNAYNALAAISAALAAGMERKVILQALDEYKPAFGREEHLEIDGKKITIFLIKNPAGANETLRKFQGSKNSKIMIALNDKHADGRDVSWLWDTSFESLAGFENTVYMTGKRAEDVALRLKHAGISPGQMIIDNEIKRTLKEALKGLEENEELVILTSYTALLEIQKVLKKS